MPPGVVVAVTYTKEPSLAFREASVVSNAQLSSGTACVTQEGSTAREHCVETLHWVKSANAFGGPRGVGAGVGGAGVGAAVVGGAGVVTVRSTNEGDSTTAEIREYVVQ
jgi:hypothetical protein